MTNRFAAEATRIAAADDRVRYDGMEMALHWATVLLVAILYALAQIWGFLPKGAPARHGMQSLHVSLGLMLAAVVAMRIFWRLGPGKRVPPADAGMIEFAAQSVQFALYGLLVTQVALGLCFRWAQHEPLSFFGLFAIPSPYPFVKEQAHGIDILHWWVANVIIALACGHAAAALFHHFVLRDDVLLRMLPGRSARRAEALAPDARVASEEAENRG